MIQGRRVLLVLGANALVAPYASLAQAYGAKIPHIDFSRRIQGGLREFGWIDGKNVVIDVHWHPRMSSRN